MFFSRAMNLVGTSPASPISEALFTTRGSGTQLAADMGVDAPLVARDGGGNYVSTIQGGCKHCLRKAICLKAKFGA